MVAPYLCAFNMCRYKRSSRRNGSRALLLFCSFGLAVGSLACNALGEPLPEGRSGNGAEALGERILEAINYEAWDSTRYIRWSMIGRSYFWDKQEERVRVKWADKEVLLDLRELDGKAFAKGLKMKEKAEEKALQQAWAYFCNDSFWLNAPAKVFDPGTERKLVLTEEGDRHLLVTYTSGGVTPGDSYLWILNEKGLPKKYKMWVSKIPIGGVEATWEDWETLSTGARIATEHRSAFMTLKIEDLKGGQDLKDFNLSENPFKAMEN